MNRDLRLMMFRAEIDKKTLALDMEVTERTIERWIYGEATPRFESQIKLARILGTNPKMISDIFEKKDTEQ